MGVMIHTLFGIPIKICVFFYKECTRYDDQYKILKKHYFIAIIENARNLIAQQLRKTKCH